MTSPLMYPCNFNSNLVLGQSERGVGLGWNWEKLTLNAFQLAGKRMDEKFERVGSLKMCVREGKWRNVTELKIQERRKADKGDEESGYLWRNGWMRKKEEKKLKKEKKSKGHTWVGVR